MMRAKRTSTIVLPVLENGETFSAAQNLPVAFQQSEQNQVGSQEHDLRDGIKKGLEVMAWFSSDPIQMVPKGYHKSP